MAIACSSFGMALFKKVLVAAFQFSGGAQLSLNFSWFDLIGVRVHALELSSSAVGASPVFHRKRSEGETVKMMWLRITSYLRHVWA